MVSRGKSKKDDDVDKILYNYTTNVSYLEEENRILKEAVANLKNELGRYKVPPLLVAEVRDVFLVVNFLNRISNLHPDLCLKKIGLKI